MAKDIIDLLEDYIPENDKRHFLYQEYLRIIACHWPAVFIMENVRGILSSKVNGDFIFEKILKDLRNPGTTYRKIPWTGSFSPDRIWMVRLWSPVSDGFSFLWRDSMSRVREDSSCWIPGAGIRRRWSGIIRRATGLFIHGREELSDRHVSMI